MFFSRYSALNLASLHARFGQVGEAKLALREAIMLAQLAEDHVCLQHILSWLYRLIIQLFPITRCPGSPVFRHFITKT